MKMVSTVAKKQQLLPRCLVLLVLVLFNGSNDEDFNAYAFVPPETGRRKSTSSSINRRIRTFDSNSICMSENNTQKSTKYNTNQCYSSNDSNNEFNTRTKREKEDGESLLKNRRNIVQSILWSSCATAVSTMVQPQCVNAVADDVPSNPFSSTSEAEILPNGLLNARVTENVLSPPPYGVECTDLFYPSWFGGVWDVVSTTTDVIAPCGVELFGSASPESAKENFEVVKRKEVGMVLKYKSRFIPSASSSSTVIGDREYNIRSIINVAISPTALQNVGIVTPNRVSVVVNVGQPIQVDLLTVKRRQEYITNDDDAIVQFDCSEVSREIMSSVAAGRSQQQQSVRKEIETTSLYTYDAKTNTVRCQQRSATFLLPSTTSLRDNSRWEFTRGKPVEVRYYTVAFTKSSK